MLGYVLGCVIGFVLGFSGSGGSILTLPVLVYVSGISPLLATSYSLFIVGVTALFGVYQHFRKKQLEFSVGFLYAIPSSLAVYFTRLYIVTSIPPVLIENPSITLSSGSLFMFVFSFLMLIASYYMFQPSLHAHKIDNRESKATKIITIISVAIINGILTGFVGAGGGFLIVPSLILLLGLPVHLAISTSLLIIAIKSLVGFAGDIQSDLQIDYIFLLKFSVFTFIGMGAGIYYSSLVKGPEKLQKYLAYLFLIVAFFTLLKESVATFHL